MTLATRLGMVFAFLFIAAVLPFVAASQQCKKNEFWYSAKSCCLTVGGPSHQPQPPFGKKCPPREWSWNIGKDCCTPHHPHPPPPKCDKDWDWDDFEFCCKKHHKPKPSQWKKRAPIKRDYTQLCPLGLTACPITSLSGPLTDFECLDITNELESCGGCASIGQGEDCTAIRGAWNVGCEQGRCAVYTCAPGFKRARDGGSCLPF